MKTRLEKATEKKISDYARGRGCIVTKYSDSATRGAPDRMILTPYGVPLFVEVKRAGEAPRPEQERYLERLLRAGYLATWVDNEAQAIRVIDALLNHPEPAARARELIARIVGALDGVK